MQIKPLYEQNSVLIQSHVTHKQISIPQSSACSATRNRGSCLMFAAVRASESETGHEEENFISARDDAVGG